MPDASGPVLDQCNIVVKDMATMVEFYEHLGCPIATLDPLWDRHHRTVASGGGLDFDLDSEAFASQWNSGRPTGKTGPVIGFHVADRDSGRHDLLEAHGRGVHRRTTAVRTRSGARGARSSPTPTATRSA